MPHPGCVNRTRLKRARSDIPPSTAEDDPRAAQCAHSKTHGVPRGTLSIHFDTRCALGRSRCALVRARSPRDRSRSSLTREQSITRLAQCPQRRATSIVDRTQSAICKVWCAHERARSTSRAATCSRDGSLCQCERRAVDSQSRGLSATSIAVGSRSNGGHLLRSEDSSGRPSLLFFSATSARLSS